MFRFLFKKRNRSAPRFLLCRPQGGLNDIFCQIEKCCEYADKFGRTVLVETDYKNTLHFKDRFSNYFVSLQGNLFFSPMLREDFLDQMRVYPAALRGRVSNCECYYDIKTYLYNDSVSNLPVTFDFDIDYREELLVHHQCGGGDLSLSCMRRMRLGDSLADALADRLRSIGEPYFAVHIRNSDMTTDYADTLGELAALKITPLFVATDNKDVLQHFRTVLSSSRIVSFSDLDVDPGQPLHLDIESRALARKRNTDAILDLLTLANSKKLFVCKTNAPWGYSGFSRLAQNLNGNRALLKAFVRRPEINQFWAGG